LEGRAAVSAADPAVADLAAAAMSGEELFSTFPVPNHGQAGIISVG
jgi:hypothetical protein